MFRDGNRLGDFEGGPHAHVTAGEGLWPLPRGPFCRSRFIINRIIKMVQQQALVRQQTDFPAPCKHPRGASLKSLELQICRSSEPKLLLKAALMMGAMAAVSSASATAVMQDGFVKAGVSDYGTLGSNGNASPGILFDKTGTGNYGINDFLTPGTPFEGFYITASGGFSEYSNNTPAGGYHGGTTFNTVTPTALSATSASWTGMSTDGKLTVTNTYALTTAFGRSAISIASMITNNTSSALSDLQFLRTLDPDPDVNAYGSYDTVNTLISGSEACATGSKSGETICILTDSSFNHMAGISGGISGTDGQWSRIPSDYLKGMNDGNGDYAIGIGFGLGTLGAGQTASVTYTYALGESIGTVVASVPEPETYLMMGVGLLALGAVARKRKR